MVHIKGIKSIFAIFILIFAVYSTAPDILIQTLDVEDNITFYSEDQDGQIGSLVHGWAFTGFNTAYSQRDQLNDFDIDASGNIYAVGKFTETESFGGGNLVSTNGEDGYLIKLSEEGVLISAKQFPSNSDMSIDKISVNSAGNIAISGHFFGTELDCDDFSVENNISYTTDIFVAVLDSNFDCIWFNSIGGEKDDYVNELVFNDDGSVLLGGMIQDVVYFGTEGTDGTGEDGFVCKFTNQGNLNWGYRINGIADQSVNAIMKHSDGSTWVGGDSDNKAEINGGGDNKSSSQAGFVLRLDSSDNVESLVPIPGVVTHILTNPSNSDIFIGGTFSGAKNFGDIGATSSGYRDAFIVKYNHPDNYSNFNQASSSDVVELNSMLFDANGNLLITGSWGKQFDNLDLNLGDLSIDSHDYIDAYVANLDPYGDWIWAMRGTSNRDDVANVAMVDSKGSLVVGGTFAISHEDEIENAVPDGLEFIGITLEPTSRQSHMFVWKLLVDTDMDGIGSMQDNCEGGESGWTSVPSNDRDSDGCKDDSEDSDDDDDGVFDSSDNCPRGEINWISDISTDPDGDGCRIDLEGPFLQGDLDADGIIDELDVDRNDPIKRNSPSQGTEIENLPLNASGNRTDYVGVPPLPMLGNDAGENMDYDDAWFDVDGDGDLDYLQSGEIFRTVNGQLESTPSMNYCEGNGCEGPLAVGDVNGDGRLDIADSAGVHLNLGNGFSSTVDWTVDGTCSGIVTEVAMGDIDGDEKSDLYIAFQGSDDCVYYTSTASSGNLFDTGVAIGGKIGTTIAVEIVDFNLDGNNDLVRLIKTSYLQVIFNSGTATPLSSTVNYQSLPIQSAQAIDVGDLDADGDVDVLVATTHEQPDRIYINNETGGKHNLTLEWTSYHNSFSSKAKISDIDGDGDLDYSLGGSIYLNPSVGPILDSDRDGLNDVDDDCIINRNYYTNVLIDIDEDGCHDLLDDDDDDGDGIDDEDDNCPSGESGWTSSEATDPDGDGCTLTEDTDDDGDGVLDGVDICPNSDQERIWEVDTEGVDYDDNGIPAESGSELGCHPGESDKDHDGIDDETDALPRDNTQDTDTDGDGFYDNPPPATLADDCPQTSGTSTIDRQGCIDSDGDGWSDPWFDDTGTKRGDIEPFNPLIWADETADTDFDSILDIEDDCPNLAGSSTQDRQGCTDTDGDGWSDSDDLWSISDGADAFPNDPNKHLTSDEDNNTDEGDNNNSNNGTDNSGDNMSIDTSSEMTYYFIGAGVLAFILLLVFVLWMLRRGDDDEDDSRDEYAEQLLSDEEVVGGLFRKKKRKKRMDDHGYADQKAQVEFGQRPGGRPTLQSGVQKHDQESGYYGEETRHDSYYGGDGGSANIGSGYTPTNDLRGKVGDDGYEWLEFPENSDRWWWRERQGDSWSPWE